MNSEYHVLMILGSYDQSAHEGIAQFGARHNWHLDVSILKDFQLPKHWRGDGIITSLNNSRGLAEFVLGAEAPVVDLSIWREEIDLPRVAANNMEIGRMGADHFIELGYRHCAWFGLAINPVSQTRRLAYTKRLAEVGIECRRLDLVRPQDGAFVTEQLLSLPKPCAVYTKSDYDSAWLANLCHRAGLQIPDEIAILGADDNLLICVNQRVPLSSVKYDLGRIGYEGAHMLHRLMDGNTLSSRLELISPTGVAIRQSTDALAVNDPLIRDVVAYLKNNYKGALGTDALAQQFGVSRRQLETKFRVAMSSSIREFLIRIRLAEAKRLLLKTDESIETIAAIAGFCHAPHFSSTFRKENGMSPTEFRRAGRAGVGF